MPINAGRPLPMVARVTAFVCALIAVPLALAAEAPPPAAEVVQDQLKHESVGETVMPDARGWHLDPAVFTELKPFTAPEIAIELPKDQDE